MKNLAIIAWAAIASVCAFGYKFGELQWSVCPTWAGQAYWPEQSGDQLKAGSLLALALLHDGAQERRYAGDDFTPNVIDFSPDAEFGLPAHVNYEAALSMAAKVFYRDIWASTFCPEFPTFGFCSCTNINLHNPGNLDKLGCYAPNLDTSGVIYPNSHDGIYESNFVEEVAHAFGFEIRHSRNPFGTTGMDIIRTAYPNAQPGDGAENRIAVSSVQNALTLLPYFDRRYDLIELVGDYYEYEYRPFKREHISYDCMRIFACSGSFEPGKNTSLEIGDYYDEYEEIATNTTFEGKAVFSYSDGEYVVNATYYAQVYSSCSVGRYEHMSDEEWERANPTVLEASKMPLVFDRSPTGDGGWIEYHRDEFAGTNKWDGGEFMVHLELLHNSSSDTSSANGTGSYTDLYGHEINDFWKGRIAGQKLFVRSAARREDFINGERQSTTNEFHAIAEGERLEEMYDRLCEYARENSADKSCATSTRESLEVAILAKDITESPQRYAAVYKVTSTDLNNEPEKKVYPCGIVIENGGYYEDTNFQQVGGAGIFINLEDHSESYTTTAEPKAILRQIDWNFKSITK